MDSEDNTESGMDERTKTAVSVMDKHVAAQGYSRVIVYTASSIGDIAHDDCQCSSESDDMFQLVDRSRQTIAYGLLDDVCYGTRKHLQALGHLEGNHGRLILPDVMDGFVNLEGVVGWQLFDSIV